MSKVDKCCNKRYIKDGDRHDRLEGALAPLEQRLYKPLSPPVKVFYCRKCGQQLHPSIDKHWFDIRSGKECCNFVWKCPKAGILNKTTNLGWQEHTSLLTAEDGTELSEYSGM